MESADYEKHWADKNVFGAADGDENTNAAEISDQDHHGKHEEPVAGDLKEEEIARGVDEVPASMASEGDAMFSLGEVDGLGNNAALDADNSAADKTQDLYDLPHADKVDHLENGTQLQIDSLSSKTDTDATTKRRESSACNHIEIFILDCSGEKPCDTNAHNAQNVVGSSMIVDLTDVGDCAETNIVIDIPAERILPRGHACDASEIDSEPQKMDNHAEIGTSPDETNAKSTISKCIPGEGSEKVEELDLKAFHLQGEQTNAVGQEAQNELYSCTGSCPVVVYDGEHLDVFTDSAQTEILGGMLDNCTVKENVKGHGSKEPNQSLMSLGVEVMKEPEDTVLKAAQIELISMKPDQREDFPLNMQLPHEESGERTAINELNHNLNVKQGHHNVEEFPLFKDLGCEADVSLPKSEVVHGLESDDLECPSHATVIGSSGAEVIASDAPVRGSCETDVLQIQLEKFQTKLIPGNHVVVAGGGCVAVSDVVSQASEATNIIDDSQHARHEEAGVSYTYGLHSNELDHQKDLLERSKESAVGDNTHCPIIHTEFQIEQIERESSLVEQPHEEPDLDESNEAGLCHQDAQNFTLEGNTPTLADTQAFAQISVTLDDSRTVKFSEVSATGTCDQSRKEGGRLIDYKQQSGTALVTTNASIDFNSQTESFESESSLAKQPHEELEYRKFQNKHLENISEFHSDELDHQKDLHGRSVEPAVGDNTDEPVTHIKVQIEQIERECTLAKQPHQGPNLYKSNETGVCHHGAQNFTLEGHIIPLLDTQVCAQTSVSLNNSKTSHFSAVASGICDQPLPEEDVQIICKQHPDAALVATDASVDSNSHTVSVEEQQGTVSDGLPILSSQALPAINTQTSKNLHAFNSASEENDVENEELFEAPSSIEPARQPAASNEIQSMQDPQQLDSSPPLQRNKSKGRKKGEVIEDRNSIPEKPHTPLKSLLAEANLESKHKATSAQVLNASLQDGGPTVGALSSKMTSESSSQSSFGRADQKEWNSPAMLPASKKEKKRAKGKTMWVPFMCCKYVN